MRKISVLRTHPHQDPGRHIFICLYRDTVISLSFQFLLLKLTIKDSGEAQVIHWFEERLSEQAQIKSSLILIPKPMMFRCWGGWNPYYNPETLWIFDVPQETKELKVEKLIFAVTFHTLWVWASFARMKGKIVGWRKRWGVSLTKHSQCLDVGVTRECQNVKCFKLNSFQGANNHVVCDFFLFLVVFNCLGKAGFTFRFTDLALEKVADTQWFLKRQGKAYFLGAQADFESMCSWEVQWLWKTGTG